jgi:arginase
VDPKRVVVIGARDLDPGEKANLQAAGVMVQSMEQIDRHGLVVVMEAAIVRASQDTDGIYVSFDMDSLDPRHASGVGTPVPAGLTQREAHLVCEMVAETGRLLGMDMVEVNPILDIQNETARLASDLILTALGKRIWNARQSREALE